MDTPYFRAGAGAIIYNQAGQVLIFKRTNEDIWQHQQGGMDAGETFIETLWRELAEETALVKDDFISITPYPTWTLYEYPNALKNTLDNSLIIGQAHRWWFLKIKPDIHIDLTKAKDKEFSTFKWMKFEEFLQLSNHSFKHAVYQQLYDYYITAILPKT